MNEIHPYNDYSSIPKGTRLLIIGTAPPKRFSNPRPDNWRPPPGDVDFYYGSKDNELWEVILPKLYPELLPAGKELTVDQRRAFVKKKGFWMHDICQEYTRGRNSALDKDLIVSTRADLRRILEEHPTINTLVFAGGLAEKLSGKQMEEQKLLEQYHFGAGGVSSKPMPRRRTLSIAVGQGERNIHTLTVPSPSPMSRRIYPFEEIIELYRAALGQLQD